MNIGVIGLGLMGGSFGRALLKKTEHKVYGFDISADTMLKAEMIPAISHPLTDYGILDLVILAVNPRAAVSVLEDVSGKLKKGAVVIDIGGNKAQPVAAMREAAKVYNDINFISTHPMAGREFYGINHAIPSLFENASVLLIPVASDIASMVKVKKLMLDVGFSNVVLTNEIVHDGVISYTSQLAHIISSAYANSPKAEEHNGFSAGSFRDLTRVAKMNPSMWAELITDNRENVLKDLDVFIKNINAFRKAVQDGDEDALFTLFEAGNVQKEAVDKLTREWKKSKT